MNEWLHHTLQGWYEANKRDLEWRHTRDPYRIWLSETILQQTRVRQGAAYYDRFLEAFPTVRELAAASEDEVLKCWQGLGYYSRARHLHAAAQEVVARFGGTFPDHYDLLRTLPGIGEYTAAAICSFAYDQPRAVVDGNVYRLYARLFDLDLPIDTSAGRQAFAALADEVLDRRHPALHNQSVMEFGALHCTPARPRCEECPVADRCLARAAKTIELRPAKRGKTAVRDRFLNYIDLRSNGRTLIRRRSEKGIWQGLYEFPSIETDAAREFQELPLCDLLGPTATLRIERSVALPPHRLSHQTLHARFYRLEIDRLPAIEGCIAIPAATLCNYPIPRLIEKYLERG